MKLKVYETSVKTSMSQDATGTFLTVPGHNITQLKKRMRYPE